MAAGRLRVCGFLLALVLGAGACTDTPAVRPPNVLIIVVDTLRADRLGAYGSTRGLTPFLDSLAGRGTVFENAYATSSWTLPSIASLFTSRHQVQHRVVGFRSQLGEAEATLAEAFTDAGYRCIGFSANPMIASQRGYAQGFEALGVYRPKGYRKGARRPLVRAAFLNERLVEGLAAHSERATAPTFIYAHYVDPHSPYDPPRRFREPIAGSGIDAHRIRDLNEKLRALDVQALSPEDRAVLEGLYDAEVAYLDSELRRLFADLETSGFLENAIVVVTSDHGEEFFEHGMVLHGLSLYEESIRVPLLVVAPGLQVGRVVQQRVSLLDLAPTLLDLAGIAPETRFVGRSLAPLVRGEPATEPERIVLELESKGEEVDLRIHARGTIDGAEKLLLHADGRPAFYDLETDPGEQHALDPSRAPRAAALRSELDGLGQPPSAAAETGAEPSEEEKAHLRSLGYIVD